MSTTTFLTTRTTTAAGLAAVAYGSSTFFNFVQDQIRGAHPLYDLHRSRPSSLLVDMLGSRQVFTDYVANINFKLFSRLSTLFPERSSDLPNRFLDTLLRELDNLTEYSVDPRKLIEESVNILIEEVSLGTYLPEESESREFVNTFVSGLAKQSTDMSRLIDILLIIVENPATKIDDAPSDLLLPLRKGLSTDFNHKGLTKARVEIPVSQWENNFVYRDMDFYDSSKTGLYVIENYDGYGIDFLLEPSLTNGITTENIYAEDRLSDYEFPRTNPTRLKEGEKRIINFDLINSPTGLVEV